MNPRAGPPLRLGQDRVQDGAADSLAPPLGDDEQVADEPTALRCSTRAARLATHPDDGPDSTARRPKPQPSPTAGSAGGLPGTMVERVTGIEPASRAWKARPGSPLSRDPTPMAQVRSVCDRPLLTVKDRQIPTLRARGGHGRRGRNRPQPGSDGHKLNRRVRPARDDHLPRWQAAGGGAAVRGAHPYQAARGFHLSRPAPLPPWAQQQVCRATHDEHPESGTPQGERSGPAVAPLVQSRMPRVGRVVDHVD